MAAAVGSNSAAGYQLATEQPVMAIGGFNGSDPSPTLASSRQYVADGEIHYFIASGGGLAAAAASAAARTPAARPRRRSPPGSASSFTAQTVDGVTVYDL